MKKRILMVFAAALMVFTLASCSSWEKFKKNWSSNMDGGLIRNTKVINLLTGETVWEYDGRSYIDGKSEAGDVTIIFYDEYGNTKKADFIGQLYGVQSVEH